MVVDLRLSVLDSSHSGLSATVVEEMGEVVAMSMSKSLATGAELSDMLLPDLMAYHNKNTHLYCLNIHLHDVAHKFSTMSAYHLGAVCRWPSSRLEHISDTSIVPPDQAGMEEDVAISNHGLVGSSS